jgi:hypothetical protein
MANPNEGMTNPLDDDKLKSIANLLASLNVELDEVVRKRGDGFLFHGESELKIINI